MRKFSSNSKRRGSLKIVSSKCCDSVENISEAMNGYLYPRLWSASAGGYIVISSISSWILDGVRLSRAYNIFSLGLSFRVS